MEVVPAEALIPADADASDVFSSISETMPPPSGEFSTQGSGSGCCWGAYNVQRSWDCCGILLNEYWTEIKFNKCSGGFCSPYLRTYSGQDGGKWKTLSFSCGPGWYPVSSDHYFYRSSGGVGYTSVTLKGHQGFGYKGGFDCGGNDYYNSYWSTVTGTSSGGWSCSYSYSWRKSLGFQYQAWCGSGVYGEK
ncbi:MAG: hypothetical protein WEB29_02215 [Chloroflexota bacterium]